MAIEMTNILRVEAGGQTHGGQAQGFAGHSEQKRRKLHALFDAINKPDLAAARPIFAALMNLEPSLKNDSQWRALGQALDRDELYVAQHFMKELQARVFHPAHTGHAAATPPAPQAHYLDPEHGLCVNVKA